MPQPRSRDARPLRTSRVRADLVAGIGVLAAFGVVQVVLITLR